MLEIMIDPIANLIGQKQNDGRENPCPQRAARDGFDGAQQAIQHGVDGRRHRVRGNYQSRHDSRHEHDADDEKLNVGQRRLSQPQLLRQDRARQRTKIRPPASLPVKIGQRAKANREGGRQRIDREDRSGRCEFEVQAMQGETRGAVQVHRSLSIRKHSAPTRVRRKVSAYSRISTSAGATGREPRQKKRGA